MRAPASSLWTLLLVAIAVVLHSNGATTAQTTPCEAAEAWEAYGSYGDGGYNSTGNLTDIGYNRTARGTSGQGGMNHTTSRNATIPMPNGSATTVPRPTKTPQQSSIADFPPFTAKTTAGTLAIVILLLAA